MNKQDVLQEKSLALGSTSISVFLIISIEYLSVVNISWIGLIFQLFVLFILFSFAFKKDNRLFFVDLICLISIFLAAGQLILLFLHEIELIPMEQLEIVFNFIGVDQDRSPLQAFIHSTGAISVYIIGIIYLRSRRLDIMVTMFENEYDSEDGEDVKDGPLEVNKKKPNFRSMDTIKEKDDEDEEYEDTSVEDEEDEHQFLLWKIYDKIIDAFTSEFVVLNICRLGLCLWILRYNCVQSIPIVIFLFHSTLIQSMTLFLPFIKFFYLPYMFLNLIWFYVINILVIIPEGQAHNLNNIKYGIIIFEKPVIEFPVMLSILLLVGLLALKLGKLSEMLEGQDEKSFAEKKKMKTLRNIQKRSSILSIIYYVFYLSIELCLLFILLINVVSKVNLSNFCLNLYMVVYLIYPNFARRNIRKFLFVIEAFNLINYVYGIIIASSEGDFFVGEIGNFIGIDSYDVYVRKYFNVIPTFRIVALIIVTMCIWNTLPQDEAENNNDKSDFEAKLYKTLYGYSRCFTETIYIIFNCVRGLVIWTCYILIFLILIINDHSIKNWVLAIMIALIIYIHCNSNVYYLNYFATYSGFVFITTWVYQFLKFNLIKDALGIENVENIPIHGEFWGYTVLSEEQLLFRVVALSALLVISVIGYRTVTRPNLNFEDDIEARDHKKISKLSDDILYNAVLKQKEKMFWNSMSLVWPVINFFATFFNIVVIFVVVYQSLYWKLSWVMLIYLFFTIGPWYKLDLEQLQTPDVGITHSLTHYSNIIVQAQRYKKWKTLMWITMIAWIIIFPSSKILSILDMNTKIKTIFYGEWVGILYPNTTPHVTFWNYVSGYMCILAVLVIENKCLEWLAGEDYRETTKMHHETVGDRYDKKNYEMLSKEIKKRKEEEDRRAGRNRSTSGKVAFLGLDEENKLDHKEKIKQVLENASSVSKTPNRHEEVKKPALKSAMKKPKVPRNFEQENEDRKEAIQPYDSNRAKSHDGNSTDDEFNRLFMKDDPAVKVTQQKLLFQYKIKFMRGFKTFAEELLTFALLC